MKHSEITYLVNEKLMRDMKLTPEQIEVMTAAMKESAISVLRQQGLHNFKRAYYSEVMGCLMMEFTHITIGVEKDGYAHS